MTIAITGATGQLGRLIITSLANRFPSLDVVGLARNPAKSADLPVSMREADYARPETLDTALSGVHTLLLVSSNEFGNRLNHHRNTIESAQRNNIRRIVYTSLLRADQSDLGLAAEHWATEQLIHGSGVPFTILRNGWYTENYTGSIPGAVAGGAFLGSARDGRISSAARADFADAAVAVLTTDGHTGRTYELAGDAAWTLSDLAAEISRHTGTDIPYRDVPEVEYTQALIGVGLPAFIAQAIASWDVGAAGGALFDLGRQLSRLIGRPTTPMSETVATAVAAAEAAALRA